MNNATMLAAALDVSMAHENLERGIKAVSTATLTYDPESSASTPVDAVCKLGNVFASYIMAITAYSVTADEQARTKNTEAPSSN